MTRVEPRNILLFGLVAILFIGTGMMQSWNSALGIFNMGLVSAIMALGVNMQWGYAGRFNVGIVGFTALGGLAAVLVSMPPVLGKSKTIPTTLNKFLFALKMVKSNSSMAEYLSRKRSSFICRITCFAKTVLGGTLITYAPMALS